VKRPRQILDSRAILEYTPRLWSRSVTPTEGASFFL
jgi:hypothetical protein